MDLKTKKCVACEGAETPLTRPEAEILLKQTPGWAISEDGKKISRDFEFKDFKESMAFINKVAAIAESEGHHPDIHVFYSKVRLELWTHAINGLFENDFIVAAKVNELLR
ncbi:MAG: 4a-hydroxytetrahydrobiopterin dehydratase [Minisyncoccia bacterium]|jgi:4a-hydroxytetrahydrobiopterin dehydratase